MPAERSGKIKENYEWKVRQSIATWLLVMVTLKSNGKEMEQVVHSYRTSCYRSSWPRGFGKLNTSPLSWIFVSFLVGPSPLSFLFNSVTVQIPVRSSYKWAKRASMHEVAQRPSKRRNLEVDLFRVNGSELYFDFTREKIIHRCCVGSRVKYHSLFCWAIVMTSPVEFSTGEFRVKQVWKVL